MSDASAAARVAEPAPLLERIRRYVEIESPSGHPEGTSALARVILADLSAAGCEARPVDAPGYGCHIVARRAGSEHAGRPLMLLGHYDTVHPVGTLERMPFRTESARAYGPGIFDMKGSIAVMVEAIAGATRARPLVVLLTCDEEVGSPTSRGLIERTAAECDAVLVLEPPLPDGSAKTARKGVATYRLHAHGRAAHAGVEPEAGVDAIAELAHQIGVIIGHAQPVIGTTVTVGRIAGGTASNVVAEHAEAEIDVRFATTEEAERVDLALRGIRPRDVRVRLAIEGGINRPPLVRTSEVERLYRAARTHAAEVGFELGEGATGGGSDGSFTAAAGVPTLDGLGVPGAGAHTLEEHILVDALPERAAFVRRLIEHL